MIEKIVLKNFMSHEFSEVQFNGSTIAVTGDNGCGKSALLEAIPYAYFGLGRETKEGVSRINGDGSHTVEVWGTDGVVVSRGRKVGGAGFCEVRVNGELVSRGKDADEWVVNHLGMSADTFMLTSFFGLGDSYADKILGVTPSARIETLQDLAHVGPYRKLHAEAKARLVESDRAFESAKSKKEGAEAALEGTDDLPGQLKELSDTAKAASEGLLELRKERSDLQSQEEVYTAFVKERERVSTERRAIKVTIDNLLESKEELTEQFEDTKTQIEELRNEQIVDPEFRPVDELDAGIRESSTAAAVHKSLIDLYDLALSIPVDDAVCPLCKQPVAGDIIDSWKRAVTELGEELLEIKKTRSDLESERGVAEKYLRDVAAHKDAVERYLNDCESLRMQLVDVDKSLVKEEAELRKKDDRFVFLSDKLGDEYSGLRKSIEDVGERIDECQRKCHTAEGSMLQIRESIKRAEAAKKIIEDSKEEMKRARSGSRAAAVLRDAWSRYGIPLRLVNRLNARIEERATAMYQEFDNGRVEVREVEDRGKPGVQFYLVDRKGDRTYSQLSMGEKVMFFISIRVAISYIVAEDSPVSVDFLVLDEAMGNLSPARRDDMVRLVNKALRKMFPQVILVTHTTIPEIFDRSLEVSLQNDTSVVRVL